MKIKKMEIVNFKKLSGVYEFNDVLLAIVGPNGAGKSTFIEALEYGLTNNCKSSNPIRRGESKMSVSFLLEDGSIFTREKGLKGNTYRINGKACALKDFNEHFENVTGLTADVVKTISSSDLLSHLAPEELSSFILSYIPDEITLDKLYKYMGEIPKEIESEVKTEIDNYFPANGTCFGTEFIEEAEKYYEEERKLAKRSQQNQKGALSVAELNKPTRTMEEVDKEIAEINLVKAEIIKGKELKNNYETALKNKEMMDKNKETLQKDIGENKAEKPDGSIDEIKKQIETLTVDMNNINSAAKTLIETNKSLKGVLEGLSKPICPLSDKLECKTDKTPIQDEITANIKKLGAEYAKQHQLFQEKKSLLSQEKERETKYLANENLFHKKEMLIKQLELLNKNVIEVPQKPQEVDQAGIAEKETSLNNERKNIMLYDSFLNSKAELEKNEKRIKVTDFIAKSFSSKGPVMKAILEYYVSYFEELCNKKVSSLSSGYSIKFEYKNNELNILTSNKNTGNEYILYADVSSGEKALTLFGLMDMLNTLTGLKILFIDDVEKFDKDTFKEFLSILSNPVVKLEYDHIFLAGATHDDMLLALDGVESKNLD